MLIKQEYYEEAYALLNPHHLRFRFCRELASGQQRTPAELPTELWFDAADSATVVHSSNSVSQWNDKSGNGRHATQTTASDRPTLQAGVLNSKAVLRFDGSNDKLWYPGGFVPGDAVVVFQAFEQKPTRR